MPKPIRVREATPDDVTHILNFVEELAEYEKASDNVQCSKEDLERALFKQHPAIHALICEQGTTRVGFALYFFNYSTWLGKQGLYLEDLYVTPATRGKGAGLALMKSLAQIAVAKDCGRFEWSVLDWNTPAREFYERIGATAQTEWVPYRLTGKALQQLAR